MNKASIKIIRKCRKNDRRAQSDLYQTCFAYLLSICFRYKRNREDAVALLNEGFLKVLLNLDQYNEQREFFSWIGTIMVHTAIDDFRKNRKYLEQTDFKEADDAFEEIELSKSNLSVMDELSVDDVKERLVFSLFEFEGYKHHEIAEQLNCSARTSKRYLASAKEILKVKLREMGNLKRVV
jgi:RNA polymerase sigma factor (sigma-70 family)